MLKKNGIYCVTMETNLLVSSTELPTSDRRFSVVIYVTLTIIYVTLTVIYVTLTVVYETLTVMYVTSRFFVGCLIVHRFNILSIESCSMNASVIDLILGLFS